MKSFKTPIERAEDDVRQTITEPRNQQILANVVNKLLKLHHPGWARDVLLCHPRQAMKMCNLVRAELEFAAEYSDYHILKTYVNFSKRSKLASGISRRKHG